MDPLTVLNAVEISEPCRADWDAMPGNDRKRFCNVCQKHVHNLSALSAPEAAGLLIVGAVPSLPAGALNIVGGNVRLAAGIGATHINQLNIFTTMENDCMILIIRFTIS